MSNQKQNKQTHPTLQVAPLVNPRSKPKTQQLLLHAAAAPSRNARNQLAATKKNRQKGGAPLPRWFDNRPSTLCAAPATCSLSCFQHSLHSLHTQLIQREPRGIGSKSPPSVLQRPLPNLTKQEGRKQTSNASTLLSLFPLVLGNHH